MVAQRGRICNNFSRFPCRECVSRANLDLPGRNRVEHGGGSHVLSRGMADAQRDALLAAYFGGRRVVSKAAQRAGGAALSRARRAGRSRRAQHPHRAQPAPGGAHHEQGLKQSEVFWCEKMTRRGPPNFRKISSSTRSRVLPFLTII